MHEAFAVSSSAMTKSRLVKAAQGNAAAAMAKPLALVPMALWKPTLSSRLQKRTFFVIAFLDAETPCVPILRTVLLVLRIVASATMFLDVPEVLTMSKLTSPLQASIPGLDSRCERVYK